VGSYPHCGFEIMKIAGSCSGSTQNAPAGCSIVNPAERPGRRDRLHSVIAGLDPAIHLALKI